MMEMLFFINLANAVLTNLPAIDLKKCKLTHTGTEYIGKLSKSTTNLTCQFWNSATQRGADKIVDKTFPDGSKVLAKNYCRNPTNLPIGPWCYTNDPKLIFDDCSIPLCSIPDCRVSGIGSEYSGSIQKSTSGKKCTKWKATHTIKEKVKENTFKDQFFPDGTAHRAGRQCRNPDSNISGPWCYVEKDDSDLHEKELCDIPFCDDLETIVYSEGSHQGHYILFTKFNSTQSLNISFRLWDPSHWLQGEIYIFLSAYDIALNREEIEKWNSGVEIMFSHSGSTILSKDESLLTDTPLILSGAKWFNFEISWTKPDNESLLIQVFEKTKPKPIAMSELYLQGTIFEFESFRFFSLGGSPGLWNINSNNEECFIHTIAHMNFTRFWLIKKTTVEKDIEVFVRAKQEAILILRSAPMIEVNQIQVTIGVKDKIKIFIHDNKNSLRQLKETFWPNILNFWKWKYFKVTFFKDKLQVFWVRQTGIELVIETAHPAIENVMWVGFASPFVSYWAIYCDPRETEDPPPPSPPECVLQESDIFNGTLSVTKKGRQCIPWVDKNPVLDKYFTKELFEPYGGQSACQNFCRNLNHDPKGAFCIVRDIETDSGYNIEHCHPRSCDLGDCKLAGTGNDYIGRLNVTRSKRKCKSWSEVKDVKVNVNNFPDSTLNDAGNYCRNPSKIMAGNWCYTNDPKVPMDLCFIRDCDRSLECMILISGKIQNSFMFILPHWRKYGVQFWLKAWNPDIYEGLVITMLSKDLSKKYILLIGDEDNEKTKLYYNFESTEILLEQKTLPHLVPTGKWGGYWLRSSHGKIELGFHGVTNSFFEWSSLNSDLAFDPVFIDFGTITHHWIGLGFQCTECLVEQTSANKGNKMYPINLWKNQGFTSSLLLNLRGTGSAIVVLMWTPSFNRYFGIQIFASEPKISIIQYIQEDNFVEISSFQVATSMTEYEWSEYVISYTENNLTVHKDSNYLFGWQSSFPLLFYWFSVTSEGGTTIWSANCPPVDVDGEPRDGNWGKWSPWICSVTCGKGTGRIERKCNDPPPNVFGKECKGSQVYEGPCNNFPCGEISPETKDRIREYLSSQHKSYKFNIKDRVVLSCNPEGIKLITREVSEINITWTHNGFHYGRTKFYTDENYSLVIPQVHEKHNGVYLCMAYQDSKAIQSKVVLEVISLIVMKKTPTKRIRKGGHMNLKCYGMALSYVYCDLAQRWEFNETAWKNYGLGTLQMFDVDKLENITNSHEGVWTCIVEQEDFGFKWTTNWIYLKVKSAPNFWSHLMEDVATAPLFGKLGSERNVIILFCGLIITLLGIIIGVTILLLKLLK